MKPQGKGFIKFSSLLLLLSGIVTVILMTIVLKDGGLDALTKESLNIPALLTTIGAYLVALLQIIAAFVGFANANKPDKAVVCKKWGYLLVFLTILWFIPEIINTEKVMEYYVYAYSIAVPLLYLVGANLNNESN